VLVDIANRETPMESMVEACGSGHLDQGLVEGLARKAHRQSENRKSRGHKHRVIVNAETPMGVWLRSHGDRSYGSCSSR
jgi:hypothetical protein